MATPPSQPPARSGMSLYASLLESADSSASISRDPVLFKDGSADDAPPKRPIDPGTSSLLIAGLLACFFFCAAMHG